MKCLLCGKEFREGTPSGVCTGCRESLSQNALSIFPTEEMIEKDLDAYEKAMRELEREFPGCVDLSLIHSLVHIKKGEYEKAEGILKKHTGEGGGVLESPEYHLILAKLKFFKDRPEEAREELLRALGKGRVRWTDCLVETMNLLQVHGDEEVMGRFLPLIQSIPMNFSNECVNVVRFLLKEDHLPEAYFLLQKYRSRFSASPQFQILFSTVAISLGEYSAAYQTLTQYIENNRDDPLAYIYLAKTHILRGEYREAARALKRGYTVDPHIRWGGVVMELREGLLRLLKLNYYRDSYEEKLKNLFNSILNSSMNLEELVKRAPPERYVEYFCTILLELESLKESVKENVEEIRKIMDRWLPSEVNVYIEENLKLIEKKLGKGLTFDAAHTIERLNTTIEYLMEKSDEEKEGLYREKFVLVQLLHGYGVITEEMFSSFEEIDNRKSSPEKYYLFFDLYFHLLDNFERNFGENFRTFVEGLEKRLEEMEKNEFPVGYLKKELQTVMNIPDLEKRIEVALKVRKEIEELNRAFWVKEADYLLKEIEVKLSSLERLGYDTADYRRELKRMEEIRKEGDPERYFDRANELYGELEVVLREERKRRALSILNSSIVLKIISLTADSFAQERYYFKSVLDIIDKFIAREAYDRVGGIYSQIVKEYIEKISPGEDANSKEIVMDVLKELVGELGRAEKKYLIYTRFASLEVKARNLLNDSYSFYTEVLTDLTAMLLTYEESLKDIIEKVTEKATSSAGAIVEICPEAANSATGTGLGELAGLEKEHGAIFRMFHAYTLKKLYEHRSSGCLKRYVQESERRIREIIQETIHIANDPDVLIDVQTEVAKAWSLYQSGDVLGAVTLYREVEERAVKALEEAFEGYRKALKNELEKLLKELSMVSQPPERFLNFVHTLSTPLKGVQVEGVRSFIKKGDTVKKELLSLLMVEKATLAGRVREYVEKCEELAEGWENEDALLTTLEKYRKRLEGESKGMESLKKLFDEVEELYLKVLYNRRFLTLYEEAEGLATSLIKSGTIRSTRMEEVERIKSAGEKAFKERDLKGLEGASDALEKLLAELSLTQNMQTVESLYSRIESLYDLITLQLRDLREPPWRDFRAEFLKSLEELERQTREESLTLEVERLKEIDARITELKRRMQMVEESWETYQQLSSSGKDGARRMAERIRGALYERDFSSLEDALRRGEEFLRGEAVKAEGAEVKEKAPRKAAFRGISRLASEAYMKSRVMDDSPGKRPAPKGLGALIRAAPEYKRVGDPERVEGSGEVEESSFPGSVDEESTPQFIIGHVGEEEFYIKEYSWVILLPGLLETLDRETTVPGEVCEEFIALVRKMMAETRDLPEKVTIEKKLQKAAYYLRAGDIVRTTYLLRSITKPLYNYVHLAKHLKTTLITFSTVLDSRREAGAHIEGHLRTFLSCVNLYNSGYLMRCGEKARKLKEIVTAP